MHDGEPERQASYEQTTERRTRRWEALRERITSCGACPRLVSYRTRIAAQKRPMYASWEYWGRPVPGFGDPDARLVIIGLAPAAHGANRTGRMFTGDSSATFLMAALHRAGLASQPSSEHVGDGLVLRDTFLTAPVRCAPPDNKPAPDEIARCSAFLEEEFALLGRCRVVLALGAVGFAAARRLLLRQDAARQHDRAIRHARFAHGALYTFGEGLPALAASYHPSRQNTQTGRLTPGMLDAVLNRVRHLLDG